MAERVKYDVQSELVKPKLDNLKVTNITTKDLTLPSTANQNSNIVPTSGTATVSPQQQAAGGGYSWNSWSLNLNLNSIKTLADAIEKFLIKVDKLAKIITQILKIVQLFSSGEKSIAMFIKILIAAIAKELKALLDSLASTGVYVSVICPNFHKKFPKYTIPVWGGYREFIQRVNATCSSTDPHAPNFNSPADSVGGVILAMVGGVSDPDFLVNLMHNFKVLSKFFGFQNPLPSAPKNFKVLPGFYRNHKTAKDEMGVQLSWETPEAPPVTGYRIYRDIVSTGHMSTVSSTPPVTIRVLEDKLSDVHAIPGKRRYKYIDFSVQDGTRYYYKVYSMIGSDFFDDHPEWEGINSPAATTTIMAHARNCIPVSELAKYTTLGLNGELIDAINFEGDWKSITVRGLLGSSLDGAFKGIDILADKLTGMVNTGSSAMSDYLDFYAEKISKILEIVTDIRAVIVELMSYNLRGTFMCLSMPVKPGGMDGFLQRFNQACQIGNTKSGVKTQGPATSTANGGIAQYTEQGIMFGVILLFAIPDVSDPKRLLQIVKPEDLDKYKTQLQTTEQAISVLMKLLGLK